MRLAVLMLSTQKPVNLGVWHEWMDSGVELFVNCKDLAVDFSDHPWVHPLDNPVIDTAWGTESLVRALRQLVHEARDGCDPDWFLFVSGDTVPLWGLARLRKRLATLDAEALMHPLPLEGLADSAPIHEAETFCRLIEVDGHADTWFEKHAEVLEDDDGYDCLWINPKWMRSCNQFMILGKSPARALEAMPDKVGRDYDAVALRYIREKKFVPSDVLLPHTYLALTRKSTDWVEYGDVMHVDPTPDGFSASLLDRIPTESRSIFSRKHSEHPDEERETLRRMWTKDS